VAVSLPQPEADGGSKNRSKRQTSRPPHDDSTRHQDSRARSRHYQDGVGPRPPSVLRHRDARLRLRPLDATTTNGP